MCAFLTRSFIAGISRTCFSSIGLCKLCCSKELLQGFIKLENVCLAVLVVRVAFIEKGVILMIFWF